MNLIVGITKEQVANLIAGGDDDQGSHILVVDRDGNVTLELLPEEHTPATWSKQNENHFQFRFESFHQGNGYVGIEASKDESWISRLYYSLLENWEQKNVGCIDDF